jgi:hypothetical protein
VLLVASVAALVALGIEIYVFTIAYPAFGIVGPREFVALHVLHSERITWSIGPALLVAAFANAALALARPAAVPAWLAIVAAAAGFGVLGITAFVQVPLHAALAGGQDLDVVRRLNANEWLRALATTIQAGADVAMLALALARN